MKDRFYRFMHDRYGTDHLSNFLILVYIVLMIIGLVIPSGYVSLVLYIIAVLILVFSFYRIFSRNYSRRYSENEKYLRLKDRVVRKIFSEKGLLKMDREYKYYKCPGCGCRIRVPRGKGRIEIRCPKCHSKFIKKT